MMKRLMVLLAVCALLAGACGGGGQGTAKTVNPSGSHAPVTLNVWSFYSGREWNQYNSVLADFQKLYPWITVKHTPGKSDQDFVRGINGNIPFDLAISPGPDSVGLFCSSQAFLDLAPYLKTDGIDLPKVVPPAALRYTSYEGDQCTLPVLSDAYGLYYNLDLFKKAGISSPPKTLTELAADAQKLTVKDPDGTIKIAGFVPLSTFYESYALYYGDFTGSKWYDENGKSAFATDPSWAQLLEWEKSLVDWYGYENLQRFIGALGGPDSEWSAAHGFEVDKIAMILDGEWRIAFIDNDKSKVNYATAPFPVADDRPDLYGAGQIGGDVVGIPRTSEHPAEAWLLLKYLALDTQAEVKLATILKNVPTTYDSLKDPGLSSNEHFKTFLDIFANPNSGFKPLTTIGTADEDLWLAFLAKWEAGKVTDLQAGLQETAVNIDKQFQLG
jgi:multiple sugar transport system substrate-binding protein